MAQLADILVEPVEGGWCVQFRDGCESLMFLSGGRAEDHARILAGCLAGCGQDVLVEFHDRHNALAGVVRFRGGRPARSG
jgi:hypothetical protein